MHLQIPWIPFHPFYDKPCKLSWLLCPTQCFLWLIIFLLRTSTQLAAVLNCEYVIMNDRGFIYDDEIYV